MPVLTRDQQKAELSRLRGGQEQPDTAVRLRIHSGVHRLSGGRPLFVTRLGEAAAALQFPVPEDCTDWTLLDARVPAGDDDEGRRVADRPVADVLLDELVTCQRPEELPPEHRAHWLDLLTHLSVAHDVECAQTLMRAVQEGRDDQLSAYLIADLMEDSGWPRCPRHFIGDLGLRRLLTRRLHLLRPGGAAWHTDHALLQGHYRDLGNDHPDPLFRTAGAHRTHHLLASDGADLVTRYLAGTFLTRPLTDWCEELLSVADAALIGVADDRYAHALGEIHVHGDTRRRLIDRLLHAVWLTEDLAQPLDETVPGALRGPLRGLSEELARIADEAVRTRGRKGRMWPGRRRGPRCSSAWPVSGETGRRTSSRSSGAGVRSTSGSGDQAVCGFTGRGRAALRRFGNWLYNTLWANWTRRIATLLGLAAVGTLVYVLLPPPDEPAGPETCATGVVRRGGECIGVNGTGYDFGTPEIGKVARAIAEENRKVDGKPHVTIAMMLPLQPDIPAERRQLRSEIQGAYLAQYRANRGENVPLIRLVLANPGDGYAQQAKVVRQLGAMAKDKRHNLRAVTGFNLSLRTTENAIGQLTNKHGIPVLASRISADGLANPEDENKGVPFPGLARIIPTNSQQAKALASFHGGLDDAETVLIKDTRPNDIYVESLAEAFGATSRARRGRRTSRTGPRGSPRSAPRATTSNRSA